MSAEFWAIIGVGIAVLGLGWRAYESLRRDISHLKDRIGNVEQRLARIEGWIAGRFREEAAQS